MFSKLSDFLRPGLHLRHRLYLATLPLSLLASIAGYAAGAEFYVSLQYLFANVLALGFTGFVYFVAKPLLKPEGKAVLFQLFAFGLLLGFSKQISTAVILVAMGLEPLVLQAIAVRGLTPLIGVWVVFSIAIISATQAKFSQLREQLISERVRRLGSKKPSGAEELKVFASEITQLISESDQLEAKELATLIRSIVSEKLRPLSHELWDREQKRVPSFRSRDLAIKALRLRPYRVWWVSLVFALGTLQPVVLMASDNWLGALATVTLPVTFAMLVANWFRKRFDSLKNFYVGALIGTSFTGSLIGSVLLLYFEIASNPLMILTSAWWLGNLIVVVGIFAVALEEFGYQKELLEQLTEGELEQQALSSLRSIRNRELANLLHSKTQNHMLAQAVRIEDGSDIKTELLQLRALLEELPGTEFEEPGLQDVVGRWQGILEITLALDRDLDSLEVRLVEEAISNAYRHGLASKVEVALSNNLLTVLDNGLGPTKGKPGLGTSLYGSASSWKIEARNNGGSRLELRLQKN